MKPNLPDLLPLPNPWICDPNGYIAMQMKDYARANQLAAYKAGLEAAKKEVLTKLPACVANDWHQGYNDAVKECAADIRALGEEA